MPIENADFFLHFIKLPSTVGGILTPNDDGTFSMYINQDHDREKQIDDYIHEFEHIINDDLYGDKDIRVIEKML